jgi:NitT/TauT family transport system ATP-binding protein
VTAATRTELTGGPMREGRQGPGIAPPVIQFEAVTFAYGPDAPRILETMDLAIRRGEFFLLLGPSGCGKSTALNIIAGFESATDGRVLVHGRPVSGPGADRVVIFQGDDSLYPWLTVAQNVEFPLTIRRMAPSGRHALVDKYLKMVKLHADAHKYPHQLSGGMRQRVQIARALVCEETEIILMDEPFAAVDAQTRTTLQDELSEIWLSTRKTILFITHDIAEAVTLGDRIGVMTAGPAARLKSIVPVDLPRPRRRSDPGFGELYEQIRILVSRAAEEGGA